MSPGLRAPVRCHIRGHMKVGAGLKIAILAVRAHQTDQPTVAEEILSRIDLGLLPPEVVLVKGRGTLLKTLEALGDFDGLVLVDGASMGASPGEIRVFGLDQLILAGTPQMVVFDNMELESEILYANKFLDLPPVRIVGIETNDSSASHPGPALTDSVDRCLEAILQAVSELKS